MGRPRGFDENEAVRAAAELFAAHPYDGISIDELVTHLGVHRNSLYKVFGSKRGLYRTALRRTIEHDLAPLVERMGEAEDLTEALRAGLAAGPALDLLLLAAAEPAPVGDDLDHAFAALDGAAAGLGPDLAPAFTALLFGLRLRARAGASDADIDRAGAAAAPRFATR